MEKNLISTAEAAKLLGISRIAVFKKIKSGELTAKKIGRNYLLDKSKLPGILSDFLGKASRREIELAVKKTVREYGRTLKMLGKE